MEEKTMRKRFLTLGLIFSLSLSLIACGASHKKPDGLSEDEYDAALRVVETYDKYLDSDISKEDAYEEINDISDSWDSLDKEDSDDATSTLLSTEISLLSTYLFSGDTSDRKMTEQRNEIAKKINEDTK